jgi:hypothetical protein
MKFRRNFLSRIYRSPEPGDDGSGAVETGTPAATPDTTGATASTEGGSGASPAPKGTMLEAMFGQKPDAAAPTDAEAAEAAAAGVTVQQLRDDKGRFAGKAPATAATGQPDPAKKPAPNDPTAMPEGLTAKAQERFQTLANTNKELTAQLSHITQVAGSVEKAAAIIDSALAMQDTFREHNVSREQFERATSVIGMMNRGDLQGALRELDEQRRLISLHLGQALPGVDALAEHPDLRAEVDNLQLTEGRALEIARSRMVQNHQQQASRQHQQVQHSQQQEEQARNASMLAVDRFCKARMADDMDFAAIEPILLKQIEAGLLEGVPYQHRAALVEKTYGLIKQTASATRASTPSTPVLRPTGGESPRQTPKTMHEAMWGTSR